MTEVTDEMIEAGGAEFDSLTGSEFADSSHGKLAAKEILNAMLTASPSTPTKLDTKELYRTDLTDLEHFVRVLYPNARRHVESDNPPKVLYEYQAIVAAGERLRDLEKLTAKGPLGYSVPVEVRDYYASLEARITASPSTPSDAESWWKAYGEDYIGDAHRLAIQAYCGGATQANADWVKRTASSSHQVLVDREDLKASFWWKDRSETTDAIEESLDRLEALLGEQKS